MNKVVLVGRLTKEPQKIEKGETIITKINIAVDGYKKGETNFINCVAFGKLAETIAKYFIKGQEIAISGNIKTGSYEKDDKKIYTTDIYIESFNFIGNFERKGDYVNKSDKDITPVSDVDLPF